MNNESKKKESILRNNAVQTIIASLLCIVIGLLIGYLVLLIINPAGAAGAITAIIKNYFYYPSQKAMMKYMGTTLVKASALLMCSLSVLFAYKVGLFNIGAAGQYVVGAGASLYFALKLGMPWYVWHDRSNRDRSPGRRHLWCTEGLFQCKRSYFLYHAELDFPVCGEYASYPGEIRVYSIHCRSFQRQ